MDTMLDTLRAVILEHHFGRTITNTEHPHSPVVLFKLVSHYFEEFVILRADERGESLLWKPFGCTELKCQCQFPQLKVMGPL